MQDWSSQPAKGDLMVPGAQDHGLGKTGVLQGSLEHLALPL